MTVHIRRISCTTRTRIMQPLLPGEHYHLAAMGRGRFYHAPTARVLGRLHGLLHTKVDSGGEFELGQAFATAPPPGADWKVCPTLRGSQQYHAMRTHHDSRSQVNGWECRMLMMPG